MGWSFIVALFSLAIQLVAVEVVHAAPSRWVIDPDNSAVHFEIKHLLVSTVRGSFARVSGSVVIDDADLAKSYVEATVEVASVYSGSWRRDLALRGSAFFATVEFPQAHFRSTSVSRAPDGSLLVTGPLQMRGIRRTVTFNVDGPTPAVYDADGREVRAVVARTRIDRKKFGLTWQRRLSGGGLLLGDEVRLEILAELMPPSSEAVPDEMGTSKEMATSEGATTGTDEVAADGVAADGVVAD